MPSQTHELFLIGGKDVVGATGPTILLRARDVTEKTCGAIADFAKQVGARNEAGPSKRDRKQRRSQIPMPRTGAKTFPAGRESLAGGSAPTSVLSTATAPRMAIDEATSGELLTEDQFRKEMRNMERKNARRVAEKSETTRSQLEKKE